MLRPVLGSWGAEHDISMMNSEEILGSKGSKSYGVDTRSDESVVSKVATNICSDYFTVYAIARHEIFVLSTRRSSVRRRAASFSSRHLCCCVCVRGRKKKEKSRNAKG